MSVRTVTPAQAAAFAQQGSKLIDVRTPAEFFQMHASGAQSVPLDQLDPNAEMFAAAATPEHPLLVICKSGARSAKACERFESAGFSSVVSIEGGTDAWARANLPVERGASNVISLERQVRISAGLLVVASAALAWWVHPAGLILAAVVGAGLAFAGLTNWCGMGLFLARMPWNKVPSSMSH